MLSACKSGGQAKEDALVELKSSLAECTSELEACQAEREELTELRQRTRLFFPTLRLASTGWGCFGGMTRFA